MRNLTTSLLSLALSTAVLPGCTAEDTTDSGDGLSAMEVADMPVLSTGRAVRNPGFAYIDVNGDGRYATADGDFEATLVDGRLSTPHSLVVHKRGRVPYLWDYGRVELDIGGDLTLQGEIQCISACPTGACPSIVAASCIVDIAVAGDIITNGAARIVAGANSGRARIALDADGDVDLKGVELKTHHGDLFVSTLDVISIDAGGDLDGRSLEITMEDATSTLTTINILGSTRVGSRSNLDLSRADITADTIEISSCNSDTEGCEADPIIDLRALRALGDTETVFLDSVDIDDATDALVRTSRRTTDVSCEG
jgi:hypothetical protein